MRPLQVALVAVGILSVGCMPPASESPELPPQPVGEDAPVVLHTPDQKIPPFNIMARLFDPAIPASDYDSLRRLYFDTFVEPDIPKGYDIVATWSEFKDRTKRPGGDTAKRTGLTTEGARHLIHWFAERRYFTVGSSKDDVLRIQGTPDEITDSKWRYGTSYVFFAKGRVTRWDTSPLSPLKVKMFPADTSDSSPRFAVRSSKDDVLFAQGPPNEFSEGRWKYGDSIVFFERGRVTRWEQSPKHTLRVKQP